ncbi:MAG: hypothetical protein VCA17_07445, partial [Dehalococcoidia bacterium]
FYGHANTYAHSDPDARATHTHSGAADANTRTNNANTRTTNANTHRNERPRSIWVGPGCTRRQAGGDGWRAATDLRSQTVG